MLKCLSPNSDKSYREIRWTETSSVTSSVEMPLIPRTKSYLTQRKSNVIIPKSKRNIKDIYNFLSINQNAAVKKPEVDEENSLVDPVNPKPDEKDQYSSNKTSVLIIKNNQNKVFKLTFRTINSHFVPLYTKQRIFVDKENDKKVQPPCEMRYVEEYTPHLIRFNTTRRSFKINDKEETRKQKKGRFQLEPPPPKPKRQVSSNKTNLQKPVLFIKVQNIHFKLSPKTMTMDFTKPILGNLSFVRDLGLETTEQKKNKGSIVAKCRGDVLKFTFNMVDINYQQVPELISRSIQVSDDSIYIRKFSEITEKIVQIPVPRKLYDYKDPMVAIKRRNDYLKHYKIEPSWLTTTRKNRMEAYKQCREVDQAQKAYEATNGSSVTFEGPGTLNKAREGVIQCSIFPDDLDKYERWVINSQRSSVTALAVEGDYLDTYETANSNIVPDWDMTIYHK